MFKQHRLGVIFLFIYQNLIVLLTSEIYKVKLKVVSLETEA